MKKLRSVQEVVQTSNMDCGPAALASWLTSCGLPVSYPRLREVCQTDVDGTSIDAMEDLANALGLPAQQVMVPIDSLFSSAMANLPCIAVVLLPNRLTHFVVVWRQWRGWVQIMDPAQGRVWVRKAQLQRRLFEHETQVAAQDWLAYARSEEFLVSLQAMADQLQLSKDLFGTQVQQLQPSDDWHGWAALDASLRCVVQLQQQRFGLKATQVQALWQSLVAAPAQIPSYYWQVTAADSAEGNLAATQLNLRGAVLLRLAVEADDAAEPAAEPEAPAHRLVEQVQASDGAGSRFDIAKRLWGLLPKPMAQLLVLSAVLVGALSFVEALVFRAVLSQPPATGLIELAGHLSLLLAPVALALVFFAISQDAALRAGRHLETQLRRSLFQHLPLIPDSYFASRLINDLSERGHAIGQLVRLPLLLQQLLVLVVRVICVLIGLVWLLPSQILTIVGVGFATLVLPILVYPGLRELDMRVRTHTSAAGQIYLDALRGSEAVAAHGGQASLEFESNSRLLHWHGAFRAGALLALAVEVVQLILLFALAVVLVQAAQSLSGALGTILLVAYWALFMPMLGRELLMLLREYPGLRNVAARVFEILDAPTEISTDEPLADSAAGAALEPVRLTWRQVSVHRSEQLVLSNLNLEIKPGEQVAIVGRSGSGKSSFLSLVLGWLQAQSGLLQIDGELASPERIALLREQSVVIDSQMYLWNRAVFDNLVFGRPSYNSTDLAAAVVGSQLQQDLERYELGLAQAVGENGSRLSGGEGQRVRIAQGLMNPDPRLVLLDEPFVGMNSGTRAELRQAVLNRWPTATLLFVVHDLQEVMQFNRLLVFAQGQIVEDGEPRQLASMEQSQFAQMLAEERALQRRLYVEPGWDSIELSESTPVSS